MPLRSWFFGTEWLWDWKVWRITLDFSGMLITCAQSGKGNLLGTEIVL